jgi:dUTP pyrophosphatase
MIIKIKKLHEHAVVPKYATAGAVAFDLHALITNHTGSIVLYRNQQYLIKTGLAFEIPEGFEMQVRQRSGLSIKYPSYFKIGVGTIDQDYRGEIMVPIINNTDNIFYIHKGMRIAQAIISPVEIANFVVVDELEKTKRGAGGFGHTGD